MKTYFYPVDSISDTSYAYPVARLRTLEARALGPEQYERMIGASDEADIMRILEISGYENTRRDPDEEYGQFIHRNLVHAIDAAQGYLSRRDRWFADYFRADIDAINLKEKAKAYMAGQEEGAYIEGGVMPPELLKQTAPDKCSDEFPEPYGSMWKDFLSIYSSEEAGGYRTVSVFFDNRKMKYLRHLAERTGSGFIKEFTSVRADCLNIEIFFRIKGMNEEEQAAGFFADSGQVPADRLKNAVRVSHIPSEIWAPSPYLAYVLRIESEIKEGRESRMQIVETETARIISDYLSNAKYIVFGPEVICSYYFRIRRELMNVKTILLGRSNAIDSETVQKRLVLV